MAEQERPERESRAKAPKQVDDNALGDWVEHLTGPELPSRTTTAYTTRPANTGLPCNDASTHDSGASGPGRPGPARSSSAHCGRRHRTRLQYALAHGQQFRYRTHDRQHRQQAPDLGPGDLVFVASTRMGPPSRVLKGRPLGAIRPDCLDGWDTMFLLVSMFMP